MAKAIWEGKALSDSQVTVSIIKGSQDRHLEAGGESETTGGFLLTGWFYLVSVSGSCLELLSGLPSVMNSYIKPKQRSLPHMGVGNGLYHSHRNSKTEIGTSIDYRCDRHNVVRGGL